jgi:tetratricopeptide (TPR) repeat protein
MGLTRVRLCAGESDDGLLVSLRDDSRGARVSGRPLASGVLSPGWLLAAREARSVVASASSPSEDRIAEIKRSLRKALPAEILLLLSRIVETPTDDLQITIESLGGQAADIWSALPWELLSFDEEGHCGEAELGRLSNVQLLRKVAPLTPANSSRSSEVRLLLVHADPSSREFPHLPLARKEAESVGRAAAKFAEVRPLFAATPSELKRAIEEFAPTVAHYVGHGYDALEGGGLVLHGAREGAHDLLSAAEAAAWLQRSSVRICVASCCWSASSPASTAYKLARHGVGAVVGAQFAWRDSAAALFSTAFYGSLVHGAPVAEAVTMGRQALLGMGADWAAPALVVSTSEAISFRSEVAEAPFLVPFPPNPDFVGREAELGKIRDGLLAASARPLVIVGIGGIGKTSLAVETAHRCRSEFGGGVFWIDARESTSIDVGYALAGDALGTPGDLPIAERARLARKRLSELPRPSLVVLDNLTDPELAQPVGGRCSLLITARERQHVPAWAEWLEPGPLEGPDTLQLLFKGRSSTTLEDLAAASSIAELLGSLPLALSLAARHMQRTGIGLKAYEDRLTRHGKKTIEAAGTRFPSTTGHDGRIFDAIDISWRSLAPAPRRALAAACCCASRGIPRSLLRDICCESDPEEFDELVGDLWDRSLVTYEEDDRLTIHELVRVYVRGQEDKETIAQLGERGAQLLSASLKQANEAMDWHSVRRELPHCRSLLAACREAKVRQAECELALQLGICLDELGESSTAEPMLREAVGLALGNQETSGEVAALALWRLAKVLEHDRLHEEALATARKALEIGEECLDANAALLGELHNGLGYILRLQGQLDEALPHYLMALKIRMERFGEPSTPVFITLNNLGGLSEARGEYETALSYMERASDGLRAQHGEQSRVLAAVLNNQGRVLNKLGRSEEAERCHRHALSVYEHHFGTQHIHTAMTLIFLSEALISTAPEQAETCRQNGLKILEELYGPEHPRYLAAAARSAPPAR